MEEMNARKKHPVFGIPFIGAIILLLIGELILQLVTILGEVIPQNAVLLIHAGAGLLLMIAYRFLFRKDFRGCLRTESLKDGILWIMLAVIFVLDTGTAIFDMVRGGFAAPSFFGVCASLSAGLSEEAVFRYFLISNMMLCYKEKGNYWPALIFSSVVFGVFHFINLANGASLSMTLIQVIAAAATGFLFGAIFLRTGNIVYTIVFHALHDFACSLVASASSGIMDYEATYVEWIELAVLVVLYSVSTFIVLKGQKEKIVAKWKEIWSEKETAVSANAQN